MLFPGVGKFHELTVTYFDGVIPQNKCVCTHYVLHILLYRLAISRFQLSFYADIPENSSLTLSLIINLHLLNSLLYSPLQ